MPAPFFKVIACEIAFREICHVAARSPSLLDLEFVTQGLHDIPCSGGAELQRRIDAVPADRYAAILLGYGLCGNLIRGLQARHTPLVIPRAHDCITFFLGSKERYRDHADQHAGTYFYSSGWLECLRRRGDHAAPIATQFLPSRAGTSGDRQTLESAWTAQYGAEAARYLLETMDDWTRHYSQGALIDFEFTQPLQLERQVQDICATRGWQYQRIQGDLGLLQRWVDGQWNADDFLVLAPSQRVAPSYADSIVVAESDHAAGS